MLPGQPVSLLGPSGDEHGPGVGVNTLGQHLLGQQREGNHQSPEQQQRAGPQIHQRIGAPHAGEQAGPGSGGSSGLPASAPRRVTASLPRWPPLGPSQHGDKPAAAGRDSPSGTAARSAETQKSSQAPGASPRAQGGWAAPDPAAAPAAGEGTWHTSPTVAHGQTHGQGWLHRAPGPPPWHGAAVCFACCSICARLQTREKNQEGRRASKGDSQDSCHSGQDPFTTRDGPTWARSWKEQAGGAASARGDQRGPLRQGPQWNERLGEPQGLAALSTAPAPAAAQLCPSSRAQHGDTAVTHPHSGEETSTGTGRRGTRHLQHTSRDLRPGTRAAQRAGEAGGERCTRRTTQRCCCELHARSSMRTLKYLWEGESQQCLGAPSPRHRRQQPW